MPIRTPKAKQLATKPEFQLFATSLRGEISTFTAAQLQQRVLRARKARDKYRDLAKRQRREARGKAEPRGARAALTNARTLEKVQLFQETMDRYAKRLKVVAAKEAKQPAATKRTPPGKKKVVKKKSTKKASSLSGWKTAKRPKKAAAKKKATAKKAVKKAPKKPVGASKQQRKVRAGVKRAQRHVAARGRRSQAKRDAKR